MSAEPIEEIVGRSARDRRVAVAYSAGVDSTVLLHALVRGGHVPVAIHCNHHLRPDSDADAAVCRTTAARLGIAFRCVDLDIVAGNSTQGRARQQRYAALMRAASELEADAIATAHHADDAVESAWLQAARGAGPVGRAGPRQETHWWGFPVVRPLIDVPKSALVTYATRHGLLWRDDPSNQNRKYLRNRLRQDGIHDVARPDAMDDLRSAAYEIVRDAASLVDRGLRQRTPLAWHLHRDRLANAAGPVIARALLDIAHELHGALPTNLLAQIAAAIRTSDSEPRRFCGRKLVVEVDRDSVVLRANRGHGTRLLDRRTTPVVSLPLSEPLQWFDIELTPPSEGVLTGELRGPRDGDTLHTAVGSKRVHDVLREARIPASQRWRWPCVYVDGDCVQVCGLRRAAGWTKEVLPQPRVSGIFDPDESLSGKGQPV